VATAARDDTTRRASEPGAGCWNAGPVVPSRGGPTRDLGRRAVAGPGRAGARRAGRGSSLRSARQARPGRRITGPGVLGDASGAVLVERQADGHHCPPADLARDVDRPAVLLDDAAGHGQADPGARDLRLAGVRGAAERLEDPRQLV